MTEKTEREDYKDLCMTCKNFSSCMYVKNGNRPVLHCKEFEVYFFRPVIENTPHVEPVVREENQTYPGICKNCGNRGTCINSKPDIIIWHCEDYA